MQKCSLVVREEISVTSISSISAFKKYVLFLIYKLPLSLWAFLEVQYFPVQFQIQLYTSSRL
jgi:hypothetical protein